MAALPQNLAMVREAAPSRCQSPPWRCRRPESESPLQRPPPVGGRPAHRSPVPPGAHVLARRSGTSSWLSWAGAGPVQAAGSVVMPQPIARAGCHSHAGRCGRGGRRRRGRRIGGGTRPRFCRPCRPGPARRDHDLRWRRRPERGCRRRSAGMPWRWAVRWQVCRCRRSRRRRRSASAPGLLRVSF